MAVATEDAVMTIAARRKRIEQLVGELETLLPDMPDDDEEPEAITIRLVGVNPEIILLDGDVLVRCGCGNAAKSVLLDIGDCVSKCEVCRTPLAINV